MLVARQHEVHVGALEALERVAGVVHHVALAAGAGHGQQVVVQHEDAQERLVRAEALLDPRVAAAADHAVVEVGLGGVDGHDRDAVRVQLRAALAEQLLEVHVADVARVVVAGDHDHPLAVDPVAGTRRPPRTPPRRPSPVRSPDTITTSGASSLISTERAVEQARARSAASRSARSDSWAIVNGAHAALPPQGPRSSRRSSRDGSPSPRSAARTAR